MLDWLPDFVFFFSFFFLLRVCSLSRCNIEFISPFLTVPAASAGRQSDFVSLSSFLPTELTNVDCFPTVEWISWYGGGFILRVLTAV